METPQNWRQLVLNSVLIKTPENDTSARRNLRIKVGIRCQILPNAIRKIF